MIKVGEVIEICASSTCNFLFRGTCSGVVYYSRFKGHLHTFNGDIVPFHFQ